MSYLRELVKVSWKQLMDIS